MSASAGEAMMAGRRVIAAGAAAAVALLALASPAGTRTDAVAAAAPTDRYALVHGCYELQLPSSRQLGPFRMQATTLGQYLLYGAHGDFLGPGISSASLPSA